MPRWKARYDSTLVVERFTVVPPGNWLDRVLEKAHEDSWVLHLHPAPVHYLVFCASAEHAAQVRQRYRQGGVVDTEAAVVEMDPGGMHVDQDCEPASRKRMERFVRWVFETLGPCRVVDHENERDLSLLASRNPDVLF